MPVSAEKKKIRKEKREVRKLAKMIIANTEMAKAFYLSREGPREAMAFVLSEVNGYVLASIEQDENAWDTITKIEGMLAQMKVTYCPQ